MDTVKILELRKEVLAEIKEADTKKTNGKNSDSDFEDVADPMEQNVI